MKNPRNALILTAAFAGLSGGIASRFVQPVRAASESQINRAASARNGLLAVNEIEKHACKGLNSCKGQGGGTKKEWGKNSCKGKGGCATDGSRPPADKK